MPFKWTAPEVHTHPVITVFISLHHIIRHFYIGHTQQPVMCGVMVSSCMRCGVLDKSHMKIMTTLKLVD